MSMIDLDSFRVKPLESDPFPYLVLDNFVRPELAAEIERDFPDIAKGGSFDLSTVSPGPAMQALIDELQGDAMRAAFAEKFGIDLTDRPTTFTLRGMSREKDGRIHTDSKTKLITVLIYLNADWQDGAEGGKLRMLRSPSDLEDYVAEVSPDFGTMVAFKCVENAWHGHKPFVGQRRSIQLNWVVSEEAVAASRSRHRISAFFKKLLPA